MKKFFILDPNPIFRHGLSALINSFAECRVVAEANSIKEMPLLPAYKNDAFFFLNLDDENSNTLDQIKVIRDFDSTAKIIGFSAFQHKEEIMVLVKNGINGLLVSSCEPAELVNAITMVNQGQDYFARPVVELMLQNYAKSNPEINTLIKHDKEHFSKRELEIIRFICQQKTAKEIGKLIYVCEKTVDFHRHKIIEKMNVRNIIGLVVYAIKNDIVQLHEI